MSLTIKNARITAESPGSTGGETVINTNDVSNLEITKRIQEWEDDSKLTFYNDHGARPPRQRRQWPAGRNPVRRNQLWWRRAAD